jgi:hypothetical protein
MIVLAEDRVPLELDCISYRIIQLQEYAQPELFRAELLYERKEFRCNIVHTFSTRYNPNIPYMISYIVETLFHKLSNELNNKDLVIDIHSKNIKQLQTAISHRLLILLEENKFHIGHTI